MQIAHALALTRSFSDMAGQEEAAPQQAAARPQSDGSLGSSPEVVGLAEAARLADQVYTLLPLGADGAAALPDSPAARESALRAMLKVRAPWL